MTTKDRNRLETEFKNRLIRQEPDIPIHFFGIALSAFQDGLSRGEAITFNAYSKDFKLAVFDEDF